MGRVSIIRPGTRSRIEEVLRDYPKLDKYISDRNKELRHPYREPDENIGGGKSSKISKPQEQMLITIEADKRLSMLEQEKKAIDKCLITASDDTKTIISELYFREHPYYKIDGLIFSGMIHCSRAQAFRLKHEFLSNLASELGLLDPY